MKEKIENLDFNKMSEEETNEFLNSLGELSDDDLKESVIAIIDKMELSEMKDESIPKSYELIFNNEKVKSVAEYLLEEYDKES